MCGFPKQTGSHLKKTMNLKHYHGGEINEWPKHLKIREYPKREPVSLED